MELNDVDRRIWQEELDEFVPGRVFDVHTHVYRWAFNTDPEKESGALFITFGRRFPESTWAALDACDRVLFPGRRVHRLAFPFPFWPRCDFEAANRFAAREVGSDRLSGALMVVHPEMTADDLDEQVERHGFLGFKPYRFYSASGDPVDCRITDFLPEHQIRVTDRRGLIVTLHLAKRDGDCRSRKHRRPVATLRRLSEREMDSGALRAELLGLGH